LASNDVSTTLVCLKTFLTHFPVTRGHIPEEGTPQLQLCRELKVRYAESLVIT